MPDNTAKDKNSTELFNGPLLPLGAISKIIGLGAAGAIICGYAAVLAEDESGITWGAGEVSLWGCIVGGALIGAALGWLWAKKHWLDVQGRPK